MGKWVLLLTLLAGCSKVLDRLYVDEPDAGSDAAPRERTPAPKAPSPRAPPWLPTSIGGRPAQPVLMPPNGESFID